MCICVGHHYIQPNTNNVNKTQSSYKQLEVKTSRTCFYEKIVIMDITTGSRRGKEKYEILICMPNPSPRYNPIFVSCQAKLLWLDPLQIKC